MTFADLALDVYRRLDYADAPPPSVVTRIQGFLNTQYVRLLSSDRMRPLRETTVALVTVPQQAVYILPVTVARVRRVSDADSHYELSTKPLEWYRQINPLAHITGTPDTWVPTYMGEKSYTLTLHPTPVAPVTYSVDIEHPITPMVASTDTPSLLPVDFHDLLSLLARQDEYEFKSDDRWAGTKLQAERRLMELRAWVDNHDVYKRTALPDTYALVARDGSPSGGLAVPPGGGEGSGPHTILSPTHTDTQPGALVSGDLLYVAASGLLNRLPIGAPGQQLKVQTNVPAWMDPPDPGAGSGDVTGLGVSQVQQVAVYADETGKVIKPAGAFVSDIGDLSLNNRIHFSGVPSTAPALVRNVSDLQAQLVDNSALVSLRAKALYEHGRSVPMGEFISVPWNPANFTAHGGMTWTVEETDQIYVAYTLIGKIMFLSLQINASSVGGTLSTLLYMKIPDGYVASHTILGTACYIRNGITSNGGTLLNGYLVSGGGSDLIGFAKIDEQKYIASANATYVYANAVIPIIVP